MAASSDESQNWAPDNFHISSNSNSADSNLNEPTTKCQLCLIPRRSFVCQDCLQRGDFVHSSHSHHLERFVEKQLKLQNLKTNLKKCAQRCDEALQRRKLEENLHAEIRKKKETIAFLEREIVEKTAHVEKQKKHRTQLRAENKQKDSMLPKYQDKVQKLGDYVTDRVEQNTILRGQLNSIHDQLKVTVRSDVQKLIKFVFPITESIPKHEPTDSLSVCDTVAALAEATNTAYIRGKWVFQDSISNEMQHIIVAPSLPANGDYSAYLDWIAHNKDGAASASTNTEILASTHPAYRISAALTYATQLTNILSFYLNVRLPHKLAYADFCRRELTEQQFNRKVSRLNTNIMYLAYTQRVKLRQLSSNHTLANILEILNVNVSDLGRIGPVDVADAPLVRSVDSQVLIDLETGTESDSDDEGSLRQEWESVPHFLHPYDLSPPLSLTTTAAAATASPPNQAPNNPQAASIAGGLVTSAAASIASIFRGWTTGR